MRKLLYKDIQELLGHKTMTLRYAYLTQKHKQRAVNLLNDLTGSKKENSMSDFQILEKCLMA